MKNEAAVLVGRPLMGGGLIVIISVSTKTAKSNYNRSQSSTKD